jgi:hypothetical protein
MPHAPEWHILDTDFSSADAGLQTPVRRIAHGYRRLAIANLDRSDPPGYTAGGVPRSDFNANVFHLTAQPSMPPIHVSCAVDGFDPATTPIMWRLVCRHVMCRYANTRLFRYRSAVETFERSGAARRTRSISQCSAIGAATPTVTRTASWVVTV